MRTQDAESYGKADSGCPEATAYLGCQSSCLDCPFEECIFEIKGGAVSLRKRKRDAEIMEIARQGVSTKELSERFGLSKRTIIRVINSQGQKR